MSLLDLSDLSVLHRGAVARAVDGASIRLGPGESLSLIGASGAGKTALVSSLLGLLPKADIAGRALWHGGAGGPVDLLSLPPRDLRALCGREIGMVFQDPATALDPVMRIGAQITEPMRLHLGLDARAARARVLDLLGRIGFPDAAAAFDAYPHQLSGGMRQRASIAAALAASPRLLIADEPVSALDAPLRAGILDLLDELRRETGMALICVTHDMDVVRRLGGRAAVMEAGRIVEEGAVRDILDAPRHPATRALIAATALDTAPDGPGKAAPLLRIDGLSVRYGAGPLAVSGTDLVLGRGETLALVGASGSGKSTLARAALGLERAAEGRVLLDGVDMARAGGRQMRALRARIQMVFQDPVTSLDPRRSLGRQVGDPLRNYGRAAGRDVIAELFAQVGLPADLMDRLPREVSGGQRQRAAIARALALGPDILVVDEGLSALDSVQAAGILALLRRLQATRGLALLMITHDIRVARAAAHRIAVMEAGRIVEEAPTRALLAAPSHPASAALLGAHVAPPERV
ncbi:nickel ABC transporter ATP-binding protein NikE [Roseovarius aquimarinus]|uniref:Nickel ABC transporter ATP-binding protein NikE n=1 Tax=Roseovarius aquimarinus TaxID=1229156 RepID=A0ABW7I5J1_9RHOB